MIGIVMKVMARTTRRGESTRGSTTRKASLKERGPRDEELPQKCEGEFEDDLLTGAEIVNWDEGSKHVP